MKERIKLLRKTLNLTQSEFGNKIGATRDAVAAYERGVNIKEPIIKLICREFNVDYFWLTKGVGEMFNPTLPLVDQLAKEYKLSNTYKAIIQNLLLLSNREKEVIENLVLNITSDIEKDEK